MLITAVVSDLRLLTFQTAILYVCSSTQNESLVLLCYEVNIFFCLDILIAVLKLAIFFYTFSGLYSMSMFLLDDIIFSVLAKAALACIEVNRLTQ